MTNSPVLRNPENERLRDSFERKGLWRGWDASPHPTIDWEGFSSHYAQRPELWEKAFSFLAGTDLTEIKPGEYDLHRGNVLVKVQQYHTREEADTRYEAHRKFADIQYVASGTERIGVVSLANTAVIRPYDDLNDIVFLSTTHDRYYRASKESFFIFLPQDSHRPCIKDSAPSLVKKVVVKVRIG